MKKIILILGYLQINGLVITTMKNALNQRIILEPYLEVIKFNTTDLNYEKCDTETIIFELTLLCMSLNEQKRLSNRALVVEFINRLKENRSENKDMSIQDNIKQICEEDYSFKFDLPGERVMFNFDFNKETVNHFAYENEYNYSKGSECANNKRALPLKITPNSKWPEFQVTKMNLDNETLYTNELKHDTGNHDIDEVRRLYN